MNNLMFSNTQDPATFSVTAEVLEVQKIKSRLRMMVRAVKRLRNFSGNRYMVLNINGRQVILERIYG